MGTPALCCGGTHEDPLKNRSGLPPCTPSVARVKMNYNQQITLTSSKDHAI